LVKKNLKLKDLFKMENPYVICINNEDYKASLEFGKIYKIIKDNKAETNNFIRIIDESGEDYLYPKNYFISLKQSKTNSKAFEIEKNVLNKHFKKIA
jgi:hypothetical protein